MNACAETVYTVTAFQDLGGHDPFKVVVSNGCDDLVVAMSALSDAHARLVARDLALLLPKLRPGHRVAIAPGIAAGVPALVRH
jgi:hypothetical protein